MAYHVTFSSVGVRAQAVDPGVRERIDLLAVNPRPPGAKRVGESRRFELWRLRLATTRILYRIEDATNTVTVIGITHRSDPYPL